MTVRTDEDGLGLSEAAASEALDAAPLALFVISASGVIEYGNREACELTGYEPDELVGLGVADLVVARDLDERPFDQAALERGHVRNRRPVARKDGSVLWVESITRRGSDGRTQIWARDLSAERYLEEEVRRVQRLETTGQLAAGLAHDFNSLLTTIGGNAELLQETDGAHDVGALAASIQQAAERAAHLTSQLLAFARKQPMRPAYVDLNALVSANLELIERVCGERVRVVHRLAADLAGVWVDAAPLTQAIFNLVSNAADAMHERGGELVIESANVRLDGPAMATLPLPRRDDRFVRLRVSDDGAGMSEEVRERVFQPFFSTRDGAAGLGLSVVEGVVAQSGGIVRVTSERGAGTCVEIFLPRAAEQADVAPSAPRPAPAPRAAGQHVMIVDDEPTLRRWLERLLLSRGYVVTSAQDGEEALEKIDAAQALPSLVITDLQMPRMGGSALAEALATRSPALPVVFMTGYAEESTVAGLPEGAQMLTKPFRSEQVLTCIRRALGAA